MTTSLRTELGDITTFEVDAIVNAANSSLMGGGGVDGAIHRAAGPSLLEECREIVRRQGGCDTGDAVITAAGDLPARHVIHTVGPVWTGDAPEEHDRLLASCYTRSLELAEQHGLASIAFPNISTGVYGFPKPRAAQVAIGAVESAVARLESVTDIIFVCFDQENLDLYRHQLGDGLETH